jgi:two-component system response regulator DegU
MKEEAIKILIVDDHDLIREGLKRIISYEKDMRIVGEADNGEKGLEMIKLYNPDVLLLDVNMPLMDGIKVLQKIRSEAIDIKVIMLTIENQRQTIHEAINNGIDGYVLKESAGAEIIDAIKTVLRGEKYLDKSLVATLFSDIKSSNIKTVSVLDSLSKRELEVLLKISKGFSNKEVGELLFLSEKTVKNYATSIFIKINAHDRVQATIIALENHIEDYYKSRFNDL